MTKAKILPWIIGFLLSFDALSQENGFLLIISNTQAKVMLDGAELGVVKANKPQKFEIVTGEHYLQIINTSDGSEKNEVLDVVAGVQKVLKYEFTQAEDIIENKILIVNRDIDIPGLIASSADENFTYPFYMYAFEKGDEIVVNLDMTNEKGTNAIYVSTYPDGVTVYSNDSFQDLENVRIKVEERSIYTFVFSSMHAFNRDAQLRVERVPASDETKDFNTAVTKKKVYSVEQIQKPLHQFVNSGSNSTFKGGKSRVLVPINLPPNTVKWYYEFSAFRDTEKVDQMTSIFGLAAELSSLIDETGLLEFGINQLTSPPGSDVCDIYILDHENSSLFTSKERYVYYTEGTRENLTSGVVEVDGGSSDLLYIGIRNPSDFHGINVLIEVVAIVVEEDWMMEEN